MNSETKEFLYILHCLCAGLIGRGVLDPDNLREDLERHASVWRDEYGADSAALTDLIAFLKNMAAEKRDVDARLAASIGVAPTSAGMRS
jgi:hypothetical protein